MRSKRWKSGLATAVFVVGCASKARGQAARRPQAPAPSFGTSSLIWQHVTFNEFVAVVGTPIPDFSANHTGVTTNSMTALMAVVHIPSGARLDRWELDYCDTNATHHMGGILSDCDFMGGDCHVLDSLGTTDLGVSQCGFQVDDLSGLNYTMDNNTRELVVAVSMGSGDATNVVNGIFVGYKLQVSPAPATATFTDVPTSSPQFKFVEALVAAGITAGCGGGNYCPTAAITRGQMAVFLATALGLHFPD